MSQSSRRDRRQRGRLIRRYQRAGMTTRAAKWRLAFREAFAAALQVIRDAWESIKRAARAAVRSITAPRRRVITWETTPPAPPTYRHPRPVLTRRHR